MNDERKTMLTKDQLKAIRADMNAALAAVAERHGLRSLEAQSATFDPAGNFTFKVAGVIVGGLSRDAARYADVHRSLDCPPLGTKFSSRGNLHEIVGINSTCSKVLTRCGGVQYAWKVDAVKHLCKNAAAS